MGRSTSSLCYYKIQNHRKQIRHSIRKMTNWEMSRSLLSSTETILYQNSAGIFLLGITIIVYILELRILKCHKRRSRNLCYSISKEVLPCQASNNFLCKSDCNPSIVNIMKPFICQEIAAIYLKTKVFVFFSLLLIIAGDVELNPGPYKPELLSNLVKDLAPMKQHYLQFGVQLGIEIGDIKCFEMEEMRDPGRVLHRIFDFWLNNSDENLRFTKLCAALEILKRNDLIDIIKKKYSSYPFQVSSNPPVISSTSCVSTDSTLISQPSVDESSGICIKIPRLECETLTSQSTITPPNDSEKLLEKFQEDNIHHDDNLKSSHLLLLKWSDRYGLKAQLRILDEVTFKWKDVATLLGFSGSELKELEQNYPKDARECCREVLMKWAEQGRGQNIYPFTWNGLHELLEDLQCSQLATKLKEAQKLLKIT